MYMQIELQTFQNGKRITFQAQKRIIQMLNDLKQNKKYDEIIAISYELPVSQQSIMLRAHALLQLRRWNQLMECCEKGIEVDPNQSQFYNMKGKAYGKIGKNQEKIQMVLQAIKLNGQIPAYHRNLGAAYYVLEKFPQAILSHTKAIQLQPENAINYHNRASSFFRSNNYEHALKDFSTAVQKNPNLGSTYGWVAECTYKMGNKFQAHELYSKAYDKTGNILYLQNKLKIENQIKDIQKNSPKKKSKFLGLF